MKLKTVSLEDEVRCANPDCQKLLEEDSIVVRSFGCYYDTPECYTLVRSRDVVPIVDERLVKIRYAKH